MHYYVYKNLRLYGTWSDSLLIFFLIFSNTCHTNLLWNYVGVINLYFFHHNMIFWGRHKSEMFVHLTEERKAWPSVINACLLIKCRFTRINNSHKLCTASGCRGRIIYSQTTLSKQGNDVQSMTCNIPLRYKDSIICNL